MSPLEIVASVLLLTGSLLAMLAALGLNMFDSVFARVHPATKAITLGVVTSALGAALLVEGEGDTLKLLLVALLQIVTAPIAGHMVARSAYRAGTELSPRMLIDELADAPAGRRGTVRSTAPRRRDEGPDDRSAD